MARQFMHTLYDDKLNTVVFRGLSVADLAAQAFEIQLAQTGCATVSHNVSADSCGCSITAEFDLRCDSATRLRLDMGLHTVKILHNGGVIKEGLIKVLNIN